MLLIALIAGCTAPAGRGPERASSVDYYVVRSGDTLFSIARRYRLDHRQLAAWNNLGDGSLIFPGQRLRLQPPGAASASAATPSAAVPAAAPVSGWRWPAEGPLLEAFGASAKTASGVHIGGRSGAPVVAAADGEVVYSGSGLTGYGQLVIVKHSAAYLSAYGHNEALLVREGERVTAGQPIARMGEGPGRRPLLHFEIRRNGAPVDPLGFLPARQ